MLTKSQKEQLIQLGYTPERVDLESLLGFALRELNERPLEHSIPADKYGVDQALYQLIVKIMIEKPSLSQTAHPKR